MTLMVYGSYGYTGELVVEEAVSRGLDPVVAGRDGERVEKQAGEHELEGRGFPVEEMADELEDVDVLLNCAGPFSHTYVDAVDACLENEVDYLDITGEIDVFRGVASHDEEAEVAGVTLIPGAGFDVVPTDCLAAHVAGRLGDVDEVRVGVDAEMSLSGGTAKTAVESLGEGCFVRQDGALRRVGLASKSREIDFGEGPRNAALFPLADVYTAGWSTGAEDVEAYVQVSPYVARLVRGADSAGPLARSHLVRRALKAAADVAFTGPDEETRQTGESRLWAEAVDDAGERAEARLRTPETYALTARVAVEAAERVEDVDAGFQTPATAFGEGYITEFDDVELTDVQ